MNTSFNNFEGSKKVLTELAHYKMQFVIPNKVIIYFQSSIKVK